jgi:hypothetical protein
MRLSLYLLPALIWPAGYVPALANGAMASFPAGGVEFRDSADISIAREDLLLSPGEVQVHYQFHSTASETQTVTIGFPLPRVQSAPDSPDAVGPVDGSGGDARNYLGFGVAVDGRPLIPKLHEYASLGEEDVTAAVLAAGLPLLPQAGSWEELVATLDAAAIAEMVAAGLVQEEQGGFLGPLWDYQAVYEWEQDFAPGDTAVDIAYRPLMGWPADFGGSYEVGEHAETACVDDALRAQLDARGGYEVAQLDYITSTARHWHGPIGLFNMTISTQQPESWDGAYGEVLFASCPVAGEKVDDHQWRFSASDYDAEGDVRVFFYFF